MTCPLTIIHDWYKVLPNELQLAMAGEMGIFHYDLVIRASRDEMTTAHHFNRFLQAEYFSSHEIITRTLFAINLIDLALSGKDDPAYWQEEQENLQKSYDQAAQGILLPYTQKDMLQSLSFMQPLYADACQQWYRLKEVHLSIPAIRQYIKEKRNPRSQQNGDLARMRVVHPATLTVEDVTNTPCELDRYIKIHQIVTGSPQNGIK